MTYVSGSWKDFLFIAAMHNMSSFWIVINMWLLFYTWTISGFLAFLATVLNVSLTLKSGFYRIPLLQLLVSFEVVLRIQTLLIRIRSLFFNLIRIRIQLFDTVPDPYRFEEVMYLKPYFWYIFTWFTLSVGPTGSTRKVYFVKVSLPVNFIVLIRIPCLWTQIRIRILDTRGGIRIRNTVLKPCHTNHSLLSYKMTIEL